MPEAWRIVKEKYVGSAFSGEGAAKTGGRWNSRNVWVVYTSSSRALAALETLVHLNPPLMFRYAIIGISFTDNMVEKLPAAALPADWQEEPAPSSTKYLGDRWVQEARSAILEVPSAIVTAESNFIINPNHPDFARIVMREPERFSFDSRLIS